MEQRDVIGADPGPEDEDDDSWRPASVVQSVLSPETLALAALLLGAISLLGFGLMNGSALVPAIYTGTGPDEGRAVAAVLIGAGLALLPVVAGISALRRLPDPSSWRALAGAGVLLGAMSVALRIVVAVRVGIEDDLQYVQF